MKSLFKIFTILTPNQLRQCAFIVFAMVIGAMLEAVGIGAILPLISIMGQPDFLATHGEIARIMKMLGITVHQELIIALAIGLILIYILKNAYLAWETKFQINFVSRNQMEYSTQLLANYLQKPYTYHLNHNTAILMRNVSSGAVTAFTSILMPTFMLLTEVVTAITIWGMLIAVDPFTSLVVAGLMGGMIYAILKIFRKKVLQQGNIQNDCAAVFGKWVNQSLGAVKETKVLCRESFFVKEFSEGYNAYCKASNAFAFSNQLPRMLIETIVVSALLLLIIGKMLAGQNPMDIVPLLGVLALAAFRLMPSANRIVNLSNQIKFSMPLFNELYDEFREIRQRKIDGKKILLSNDTTKMVFGSKIVVRHLRYQYPDGNDDVLDDVSVTIPKGKFVGIIGSSGAGKTTFVDILLGLLQPTGGSILIDGKDIQQDIRAWQENLSYVPQTIYLLDGTICENIALGTRAEDIDTKRVEDVLKMAELYEFVQGLPEGVQTSVGERGVKLSGGQRQRIGIARALYYKPEVLVLDEATSALDSETEKGITDTILKLKGQITIVAIAHRISTLENCDFKIKFEDGVAKLVE